MKVQYNVYKYILYCIISLFYLLKLWDVKFYCPVQWYRYPCGVSLHLRGCDVESQWIDESSVKKELKKNTKICHSAQSISQLSLGFCVFRLLHQYLPGLCLRAHVLQTCVHCVGMSGAFRGPFIHHQVDKSLILPRHNYAYWWKCHTRVSNLMV